MIFRKILPYAFLLLNLGYRYVSKFVLTHFSVELSKMESKFSFFKRLVHRKLFEISGKKFFSKYLTKGRNETNDISRPYTLNADQQMMIAFVPNKTVIPLVFCFVQQEEIIRKQFHQYKKTCRCRETKPVPTYIESTTSPIEH